MPSDQIHVLKSVIILVPRWFWLPTWAVRRFRWLRHEYPIRPENLHKWLNWLDEEGFYPVKEHDADERTKSKL